jgi:hypothetical protein
LANHSWHDNSFVCTTGVVQKLQMMTELVQRDDNGCITNTAYDDFSAFLDSMCHNEELLNFFKKINSSQVMTRQIF